MNRARNAARGRMAGVLLARLVSLAAIAWSWHNGALLNYGDAVAHLHIARRVFDSRYPGSRNSAPCGCRCRTCCCCLCPGLSWWANGMAGIIPSALAYLAACAGIYRLARRWLAPAPRCRRAGLFRAQSQPALPADHGHDRAAVCLRDDLDRGVAGGVANRAR